ncbi:hypothetical protein KIH41_07905 [Litoribacter ruber]|uniref:DUF3311 domain-containing protein n=1 Tax=Litoribacter ruber TaxID=702568 RepID=A0AAP2CIZ5_9BACT|nr:MULTISPECIES: hypothetical protein [Litoribacter]MBS9522672.1 hypothetical protein [Litoribacter alkaliphilus]MBT0811201.1 hypothetical protein [Litoribacter ruber]
MKTNRKNQFLVVLFLMGMVALNYPVLSIYNVQSTLAGIPVLYFMVFSNWILLIGFTLLIISRYSSKDV